MTFQVALIAVDGVILASDKRETRIYPATLARNTTGIVDKLFCHPSDNLMYACAGGAASILAGREILSAKKKGGWEKATVKLPSD